MYEVGQQPTYCDFIESYLMNSCACVAIFPPSKATVGAEAVRHRPPARKLWTGQHLTLVRGGLAEEDMS
jgi:hypothetical protein